MDLFGQSTANQSLRPAVSMSNSMVLGAPENGTSANFTSAPLYIPTSDSGPMSVGFNGDNSTSTDRNSTGFDFYGAWLFHRSTDGHIEMNWFASPTDDTDILQIKWDASGAAGTQTSATAISLRTMPPVVPTV